MINSTLKLKFCIPLLLISLVSLGQEKTISGKITDAETGDPLPGVSILVKEKLKALLQTAMVSISFPSPKVMSRYSCCSVLLAIKHRKYRSLIRLQ